MIYHSGDLMDCINIVQTGTVELRSQMDQGTEVVIERLSRGAILGAYSMLVQDEVQVEAICTTAVTMFTIDRATFTHMVGQHKKLLKRISGVVDTLIESPMQNKILDFIQLKREIVLPNGDKISGEEAMRASELCHKLKNVIMQVIVK